MKHTTGDIREVGKCSHLDCLVYHPSGVCTCDMARYCRICNPKEQSTDKDEFERIGTAINEAFEDVKSGKNNCKACGAVPGTEHKKDCKWLKEQRKKPLEEKCTCLWHSNKTTDPMACPHYMEWYINTEPPEQPEGWEKRFDDRYKAVINAWKANGYVLDLGKDLKFFIAQVREEAVKRTIEEVEKIMKDYGAGCSEIENYDWEALKKKL